MELVPFDEESVAEAATMAAAACAGAARREPLMPARWTHAADHEPALASLAARGSGVALRDGRRLAGYLAGWEVEARGERWTYVPECGWAARRAGGLSRRTILEELYAAAAARWVEREFRTQYVGVLAGDRAALQTWAWLGFGTAVMDGLRDLAPIGARTVPGLTIRRGREEDATTVGELEDGLRAHLAASPVFFALGPPRPIEQQRARLADPGAAVLLAELDGRVVAHLLVGPASDDAATVIRDAGTASITGAFTRPEHRRGGIADALLEAAISWARDNDYVRMAVDFETANLLATRFWTRHFRPVTYSLARRV